MKPMIFVITMLTALVFLFQDAFCQERGPTERVRAMLEGVMAVQSDPQLKGQEFRGKRRTAIKDIIAKNFYFDSMARQSLGQSWDRLEGAKQLEFKAIFQDLFQESYTRLVLDFLGREKVLYNKADVNQDRTLVMTTIVRTNEEISVDYSLTKVKEKWLVGDVKIDGVSIVQNYQKSFSRVIRQESYEGLLKKMRMQQKAIEKN